MYDDSPTMQRVMSISDKLRGLNATIRFIAIYSNIDPRQEHSGVQLIYGSNAETGPTTKDIEEVLMMHVFLQLCGELGIRANHTAIQEYLTKRAQEIDSVTTDDQTDAEPDRARNPARSSR